MEGQTHREVEVLVVAIDAHAHAEDERRLEQGELQSRGGGARRLLVRIVRVDLLEAEEVEVDGRLRSRKGRAVGRQPEGLR